MALRGTKPQPATTGGEAVPNLFRHFPREVDMRTRKVVHNRAELQRYISAMNGKENITTTVYGFRELKPNKTRGEYVTAVVPHFVIDMDKNRAEEKLGMDPAAAGERCAKEAWDVSAMLLRDNIMHMVWFTGGGFHIWVVLDQEYALPPKEMNDLMFSGRDMINRWVRDMDLITLDPVVSFRPDRHIRIPNSFNFKRGVWSIPLVLGNLSEGWEMIQAKASEPSPGIQVMGSEGMVVPIVKRDPNNIFSKSFEGVEFNAEEVRVEMERVGNTPVLPCLAASACEKGSNPAHQPRTYLMMYLLDFFRRFARPPQSSDVSDADVVKQAHAFIRNLEWADYKPNVTQTMLNHGAGRYYQTPTCPTLYAAGLCVGRCPYYDGKGV